MTMMKPKMPMTDSMREAFPGDESDESANVPLGLEVGALGSCVDMMTRLSG